MAESSLKVFDQTLESVLSRAFERSITHRVATTTNTAAGALHLTSGEKFQHDLAELDFLKLSGSA